MAKLKLTARTLAALRPQPQRADYFDASLPGFHVRVTPNGVKTFSVLYRHAGRLRRYSIGTTEKWTLADARDEAREIIRGAARGGDPQGDKQQERAAETFADLAAQYLKREAVRKKTGKRDEEYLRRDVLPQWGRRKAASIKRRDIIRLLEAKAENAPIAANRLLALVRRIFRWAVERDELDSNPCSLVKAPGGKEKPRKRVLDEVELRRLWLVLESGQLERDGSGTQAISMSPEVRAILRLILATGQRPGECAGLEWSEIDDASAWWTIPGTKTKNELTQRVPLTCLAKEILAAQPREGRYVFPSPRRRSKSIEVNALTHALRRNGHLGLPHFTAHDLRRTASDWMARIGIDGRARAAVLNHKPADVTEQHYTVYSFDAEKKAALRRWEKKLRAIVSGKSAAAKVVSIG